MFLQHNTQPCHLHSGDTEGLVKSASVGASRDSNGAQESEKETHCIINYSNIVLPL